MKLPILVKFSCKTIRCYKLDCYLDKQVSICVMFFCCCFVWGLSSDGHELLQVPCVMVTPRVCATPCGASDLKPRLQHAELYSSWLYNLLLYQPFVKFFDWLYLVGGPHPAMIKRYFWFFTQKLFLEVLGIIWYAGNQT